MNRKMCCYTRWYLLHISYKTCRYTCRCVLYISYILSIPAADGCQFSELWQRVRDTVTSLSGNGQKQREVTMIKVLCSFCGGVAFELTCCQHWLTVVSELALIKTNITMWTAVMIIIICAMTFHFRSTWILTPFLSRTSLRGHLTCCMGTVAACGSTSPSPSLSSRMARWV